MKKTLKIAILNLQSGIGVTKGYWQYPFLFWKYFLPHSSDNLLGIGDFARDENIGIFGLTEVDAGSLRSRYKNQADLISDEAGFKHKIFFPTHRPSRLINHGNALLSDYPILKHEMIRLPGNREPRYLMKILMKTKLGKINIFLSHLSIRKWVRKIQIKKIVEIIGNTRGSAVIIGDFNTSDKKELRPLLDMGFKITNGLNTYPSWNPTRAIDFILVKNLQVRKAYTYKKKLFSDHLALVVEVGL
jgi:endonuclease/exonuclease/phosphatase family metal-dependent hydrolase